MNRPWLGCEKREASVRPCSDGAFRLGPEIVVHVVGRLAGSHLAERRLEGPVEELEVRGAANIGEKPCILRDASLNASSSRR